MTEILDEQFGGSSLYSPINAINNINAGVLEIFAPKLASVGFDGNVPNIRDTKNAGDLNMGDYILLQTSGNDLILGTDYADADSNVYLITKVFREIPSETEITIAIIYNQQERNIVLTNTDTAYYTEEDWANRALGSTNGGWMLTSAGNAIFNNVAVRGNITATGGSFTGNMTAGTMKIGADVNSTNDGIYIDANNFWYDTGNFSIGNGTSGVTWNGTTLAVTGTITATLGSIGGFTIGSTSLTAGSGLNSVGLDTTGYPFYAGNATPASAPFRVTTTGELTATNATVTGTITATSGTIGGFTIGSSSFYAGSGSSFVGIIPGSLPFFAGATANDGTAATFKVTNAGALTATSGTVGGWTLGSTTLTGTNTSLSNTGVITVGTSNDVAIISSADSTYRLWIGNATASSAPFRVTKSGGLTATNVNIIGPTPTAPTTKTITAVATSSPTVGKVTYTSTSHGYSVGNSVSIYGIYPFLYNGTYTITDVSTNTFSVSNSYTWTVYDANGYAQLQSSEVPPAIEIYSTGTAAKISNTQNKGVINIIGTENITVFDANDIQTFDAKDTSSPYTMSKLNIQRLGGDLQIGSASSTSDTYMFGDVYIDGNGGSAIPYALQVNGTVEVLNNLRVTGNISTVTNITATADIGAVTGTFTGIVSTTNEFQAGDGSATDPSYTFGSDGDTGIFRYATNAIGFAAGGLVKAYIDTTQLYASPSIYFPSVYSDTVSTRQVYVGSAGRLGTVSSTRRVKSFIQNIDLSLESSRLLDLELVTFKYNADIEENGVDNATVQLGFIAEQAEELGLTYLYGVDESGIPDYFAYEKLPLYMFDKMKKQEEKIKQLEERLAILEK